MISLKHINLFKYIMNNPEYDIYDISQKLEKTTQQIRKEIKNLNLYLNKKDKILINNSKITTHITYEKFIDFTSNINFNSYSTTLQERLNLVSSYGYFFEYINLTKLYDQLGVSLTTKKKDTFELEGYLENYKQK